jgi:hypothetical protein
MQHRSFVYWAQKVARQLSPLTERTRLRVSFTNRRFYSDCWTALRTILVPICTLRNHCPTSSLKNGKAYSDLEQKYLSTIFSVSLFLTQAQNLLPDQSVTLGRQLAVQCVCLLLHKPKGRGFDSRWCHWIFSLTSSFRLHYGPGVDSASNRNEYQECLLGVKAAGA